MTGLAARLAVHVVVALVAGVPVPVVDIVDVVIVLDGLVAATLAVDVRMFGRLTLAALCRCGHVCRLLGVCCAARLARIQGERSEEKVRIGGALWPAPQRTLLAAPCGWHEGAIPPPLAAPG
jgi:hypothetical protein